MKVAVKMLDLHPAGPVARLSMMAAACVPDHKVHRLALNHKEE